MLWWIKKEMKMVGEIERKRGVVAAVGGGSTRGGAGVGGGSRRCWGEEIRGVSEIRK